MSNDSQAWKPSQAPLGEINYLGKRVDEEGRARGKEEQEVQRLQDERWRAHLNSIERARIAMNNTAVEQGEEES